MKQDLKYRNYYKCALTEGVNHGFDIDKNLELNLSSQKGPASYITRAFDTGDTDMTYQRLFVDCDMKNVKLEVIVAVTSTLNDEVKDGILLKDFLANPKVAPALKEAELRKRTHVRYVNTCDMLLHELKGRYVWIYIACYPNDFDADFKLRGMKLEFPKYSFTEYFPEIYQGEDFFERYIGVLQTMFLELEKKVDQVPRLLDYEGTDDENVEELAMWLGIDNKRGIFTPNQLRYMIKNIDLYQGGKGTKLALEKMIELVTGIKPQIVEAFQWQDENMPAYRIEQYKNLYGETGNYFCVILDVMSSGGKLKISEEKLEELIGEYSMVGTKFKVVLLDKSSHTDGHCYLDINSVLSIPEIAAVDKVSLGSHITVG